MNYTNFIESKGAASKASLVMKESFEDVVCCIQDYDMTMTIISVSQIYTLLWSCIKHPGLSSVNEKRSTQIKHRSQVWSRSLTRAWWRL